MHHHILCFLSVLLASIVACAKFDPDGISDAVFQDRVQTETQGDVTVSAAVLTENETHRGFDVTMQKEKIQPVWLRVQNDSEHEYIFLAAGMDPAYFSPHETARANHFFLRGGENKKMDAYLYEQHFDIVIAPESISEGIVYSNLDKGMKFVNVSLLGNRELLEFPEVARGFGKIGRARTPTDPAPLSMVETIITLKPREHWRPGMTWDRLIGEMDEKLRYPGMPK